MSKSFACPPGKLDAVDGAGEVDLHPIARLRAIVDRRVLGALPAEHVDRAIDVGRVDLDLRPLDRRRGNIADGHLGIDLEHRGKLERAFRLVRRGLDARIAGNAQVLLPHRFVEARLDGIGNDVGAHLGPVLRGDHLERYVARPESRHLHRLRETREALVDLAFDLLQRDRDVQAPLKLAQGLQRALHGFFLDLRWCERGDSNPHGLPRQLLRLVRLPIPPLSRPRRSGIGGQKAASAERVSISGPLRLSLRPRGERPRRHILKRSFSGFTCR